MSESTKLLPCPHCGRLFSDENGRWQHAKSKHGKAAAKALQPAPSGYRSMGDLVAEAHWNADPELDWVRDMFDIKIAI